MAWHTEGEKTNPGNNDLLADTGPVPSGNTLFPNIVVAAGAAASAVRVQHRNADNNATVKEFRIKTPANDTKVLYLGTLALGNNERLRVVQDGVYVGVVQALISDA